MAKRQSAGELSRTIAGQWSKSQKRSAASTSITEAKQAAQRIRKAFALQQRIT
jgi:hypothetical protein